MKRLNIYFLLAGTLLFFVLLSCSKGGGTNAGDDGSGGGGVGDPHVYIPSDTIPPQITIYTPVTDQVFTHGTVINITGKLTDDYGLYQGTIKIVNNTNGMLMMSQPYEIHGLLSYNFNINHTVYTTAVADYTVTVSFEDHGLNFANKSVKVNVSP